jgi:3-hydroxyisobutyrate dehydrogenase
MKTIWWIGTWVMGQWMVNNLLKAGYNVNVFNRTISKTKVLVDAWAILCNSIAELTKKSDIIVTIIWMPKDIEQVYFEKWWILENIREWQYVVDMTTTSPTLSIKIYNEFKKKNISTLDAPVSGWDIWAKSGNLAIMIWGDEKTYNKIYPIFDILGANIVYEWKAWSGQHTKMANQISIAGNTIALCESLIYAEKVWLNLEKVSKIIASWAGWSWWWTNLSPRILKWELDTCFFVKHFVKDMWIVLEESRKMNLSLPWLSLVNQLYISLLAEWWENLWTQALIKVLKKLNNM